MSKFSYVFLVNKKVEIKLNNGECYSGKVTQAFDNYVVLDGELYLNQYHVSSIKVTTKR